MDLEKIIKSEVKKTSEYKKFVKALRTNDIKTAKKVYIETVTELVLKHLHNIINADDKLVEKYIR